MIDIVFLGTPDFAVYSLKALVEAGYPIKEVITQPDRPKGRGQAAVMSAVKQYALCAGIPVFQPEKIKSPEAAAHLRALAPDLMITAAFGQILSAENLAVPPLGCVNVHASLLPAYRGAAPIQWAIINGETVTGVTTMYTEVGLDCGDIILKKEAPIYSNETAGRLFDRLAVLGAETLLETVRLMEAGNAPRTPQDHSKASHYPMITREMAELDFRKDACALVNLVRGMNPWPVAYTCIQGQVVKVFEAVCTGQKRPEGMECGTVVCADDRRGLLVAAGDELLELVCIQRPNCRRMDAKECLRGHRVPCGIVLGKKCP